MRSLRWGRRGGFRYLEAVGLVIALIVAVMMVRMGITWSHGQGPDQGDAQGESRERVGGWARP